MRGGAIPPNAAAVAVEDVGTVHGGACAAASLWRQEGMGGLVGITRVFGWGVRWALPSRCPGCGAVAEADHRFCSACWGKLRFLGPPWCAACGVPFAFDRGTDRSEAPTPELQSLLRNPHAV